MATKKEVWLNNRGEMSNCEFDALVADLDCASNSVLARGCGPDSGGYLSTGVVAAIDALHEYAHRGDKAADTQRDSGTALPEGVPPELDDWVKRWEWITARVTEDAVLKLRKGDEVRIGVKWYAVSGVNQSGTCLALEVVVEAVVEDFVPISHAELAAIANEVRYNGH